MSDQSSVEIGGITTLGPVPIHLRPELKKIEVTGVEEHVLFPDVLAIPESGVAADAKSMLDKLLRHEALVHARGRTSDIVVRRIRDMDE